MIQINTRTGTLFGGLTNSSVLVGGISTSMEFTPAASVASGKINANTPSDEFLTFTRASTATFLGSDDLLQTASSGVPRIDYLGNSSGHILLEPSRTNVFRRSNELSDASWWSERNSVSLTSSEKNITSPTGTDNDAWTLTTDSGGGTARVGMRMRNGGTNNHTITASTSKTVSIFVKKSSYDFVYLQTTNFQSDMNGQSWFNISTGALGTKSANHTSTKIEDYKNGWYRCSVTITAPASPTDNSGQFNWYVSNADTETTVTEDGTSTSFWYGGQVEVGEYVTSYIETTSAAVTRSADAASGAGDSTLFNDSEGTIVAEYAALADDQTNRFFGISDGTDDERVVLGYGSASTNRIRAIITNAGTSTAVLTNAENSITNFNKVAVKYKEDDVALWINGSEAETDTDAAMPSGLNEFLLDSGSGASDFYGKIKSIKIYKSALSDEDLTTETS